ncbi:hypothetical protein [Cryobacterium psychrophilum]|uniref:MFS transporter n=1 Tax=Cryobacterium psychrophilum TaxID=41988 RepID=A0A4Y8KQ17_9MICO|nr:hypothetical protein [Cryobacterium psychrophilum]TDW29829.1 hypothetical protein EDD25_1544 [Cryobacterium psychrophilum]TFD76785.1 hypothetical protein E3T53_13005 [Cryobacterium psychrophilum]
MRKILSLGRRGTFWSAAVVLALCLWASGAPSVLYPVYAADWDLPAVVTTSVFGAYPLALLLVLLFFGGVSDAIGRPSAWPPPSTSPRRSWGCSASRPSR